jgi:aryl-alcohol dehydrogenase-like predicted oxidoreductase
MRHKLLGPSGLRVSELCLGTLTFGEKKDWGADAEAADAILAAFGDAGGTFIDTAPNYSGGAAEEIVGGFLKGHREDFVVATKFTASTSAHPLAGGNSRKSMVRAVEGSLRRLDTDHIDLLWLHYWDGTTPLEEILRALDDLVSAGKVLYTGISDTPAWLISRATTMAALRGWSPVVAVQLEYNLASRTAERELRPMATAMDLGVVCWGPLAAGALAGGTDPRRRKADAVPAHLARVASEVRRLSLDAGVTVPAMALGWLMQRQGGASTIPIVGARSAEQIEATLAAAATEIDRTILVALDAIAPPELGFPHELIGSSYLRKLALGDPAALIPPARTRS